MKKHDWQYKSIGKDVFLVTCADCGRNDQVFLKEDAAKGRIKALNAQKSFTQKLNDRFTRTKV